MIQLDLASLSSNDVVVTAPVEEFIWKLLPATPFGMLYVRCVFIAKTQKHQQLERLHCYEIAIHINKRHSHTVQYILAISHIRKLIIGVNVTCF